LIRRLLREKDLGGINVGTIEDFQAVERQIILLSLTRSNESFVDFDVDSRVGAFRQPKRTNVAMTRAEEVFIVVGNPNIMSKDPIWRQFLWFCLRNGLWFGEGQEAIEEYFKVHPSPRIARHLASPTGSNFFLKNHQPKTGEISDDDIIILSTMEEICIGDLEHATIGLAHHTLSSTREGSSKISSVRNN
jgi:hypothetical protein